MILQNITTKNPYLNHLLLFVYIQLSMNKSLNVFCVSFLLFEGCDDKHPLLNPTPHCQSNGIQTIKQKNLRKQNLLSLNYLSQ